MRRRTVDTCFLLTGFDLCQQPLCDPSAAVVEKRLPGTYSVTLVMQLAFGLGRVRSHLTSFGALLLAL